MNLRPPVLAGACLAVLAVSCGTSSSSDPTPTTVASGQQVFEADHFAAGAIVGEVTTENCTLSDGTMSSCARVTVSGYPSTYTVGPFCPDTISTPAAAAGIWFDGSGVYDLDGPFVEHLATFYDDTGWKLYDDTGKVNVTDTKAAFEGAARPDVAAQYENHCVEGQLAWLPDGKPIQTTMLIPLVPARASSPSSAHPGDFGLTFDGVVMAESAPVDAILGAHTIAAFDDCGGHYNPVAGYHLHGATGCGHLEGDIAGGETKMFGYAADGYPIHLPLDDAAAKAAGLDACNGHSTASEGYHYHANTAAKNAILPCLVGKYVATGRAGGPPQGPPPGRTSTTAGQTGVSNRAGQTGSALDLASIATRLGVTEHQLADAVATGDINAAAAMLGTTAEAIAAKLGVSVADLRVALTTTTTR